MIISQYQPPICEKIILQLKSIVDLQKIHMHLTQGFRSDPQSQFWAAAPLRLDEYSSRNNTLALFPFPEEPLAETHETTLRIPYIA